jgi:hypothetical protein
MLMRSTRLIGSLMQKAGPYLLLEILLPGGTLFALLLFVYRRRETLVLPHARRASAVLARALTGFRLQWHYVAKPISVAASVWRGRHASRDGLEALAIAPTM